MRRGRAVLAALALVCAGACAALKNDKTVCPEFRNLRCAVGTDCDMDKARGCRVCRCQSIDGATEDPIPDDARPAK